MFSDRISDVPKSILLNKTGTINTMRLNFTSSGEQQIREGIGPLGESIEDMLKYGRS